MNRERYAQLLEEKTALQRMIDETPEEDVIDRGSLVARLEEVEAELAAGPPEERAPARARLTFRGRPVVGSHGILADFGASAVSAFAESVTAMAASLTAPLAPSGPIPNREQHQMLITSAAVGSFGFELEEHRAGQLTLGEPSPVAQALDHTRRLLEGTLGSDEQLADSATEVNARVLDKVRAFLEILVDGDAVCAIQVGEARVAFSDVGQVKNSLLRLAPENLKEEQQEILGELRGVLPEARQFEFKPSDGGQVIRGKVGPTVADTDALSRLVHRPIRIKVAVTRVGSGRPRYVLVEHAEPEK